MSSVRAGIFGFFLLINYDIRSGKGKPLQYSCPGNPTDRGAWWATVHGGRKRVKQDIATKQQQKKDKLEQAVTNESICKGL